MSEVPGARPFAAFESDGARWRLFDAWRSARGLGLGLLVRDGGEAEARRVPLDPETDVTRLDAETLRGSLARSTPLTPTERCFLDAEGAVWLAQGWGPVWAEGAAGDAIGTRLRCVSRDLPLALLAGVDPERTTDADLRAAISSTTDAA